MKKLFFILGLFLTGHLWVNSMEKDLGKQDNCANWNFLPKEIQELVLDYAVRKPDGTLLDDETLRSLKETCPSMHQAVTNESFSNCVVKNFEENACMQNSIQEIEDVGLNNSERWEKLEKIENQQKAIREEKAQMALSFPNSNHAKEFLNSLTIVPVSFDKTEKSNVQDVLKKKYLSSIKNGQLYTPCLLHKTSFVNETIQDEKGDSPLVVAALSDNKRFFNFLSQQPNVEAIVGGEQGKMALKALKKIKKFMSTEYYINLKERLKHDQKEIKAKKRSEKKRQKIEKSKKRRKANAVEKKVLGNLAD